MQNVGAFDRLARIVLGVVLLAAVFVPSLSALVGIAAIGAWKWAIAAVGLVMLGTAFIRFCPLYAVLGVDTGAAKR